MTTRVGVHVAALLWTLTRGVRHVATVLDWMMTLVTIWTRSGVFWRTFEILSTLSLAVIQTSGGQRKMEDFGHQELVLR